MPASTGADEGGADEEGAGERGAGERGAAVGRQVERGQPANQHARISRTGVGVWWVPGTGRASCLGLLASAGQGVRGSRGRAWDARLDRASASNHLLLLSITAMRCSCCSSRSLADEARAHAQADHLEEVVTLRERARRRSACGMVCACGDDEAPVSQAWAARTRLGRGRGRARAHLAASSN
jgi:hypothetical protein